MADTFTPRLTFPSASLDALAEQHAAARADNPDARRAALIAADLRGPGAAGATLIDGGINKFGCHFWGADTAEGRYVIAGCQVFTLEEARAHWANNADALARVEVIAAAL